MTCIFGSSGKIGSMFRLLLPKAQCASYKDPVFEPAETYIFCNHSKPDYRPVVTFTKGILEKIPDIPEITIINIASDAEIIPIPGRLKYGKLKKHVRKFLEQRKNRVINIFFPYVTKRNWSFLFEKLSQVDLKRDFYYLSPLSNLVKPLWFKIQPVTIHTDINWSESQYCTKSSFDSRLVHDESLYEKVRVIVEDRYRLDLVPYENLKMGFLAWQLAFEGPKPDGKNHIDMKRCLFGNLFRALLCVENTTDYEILIGDQKYTMQENDIIVIPGGLSHQPLRTTKGSRKIIVMDYFTSAIPNPILIFLFYLFNTIKILGVDV
jgi:hypothetical protein